jgi:hypothetical protein
MFVVCSFGNLTINEFHSLNENPFQQSTHTHTHTHSFYSTLQRYNGLVFMDYDEQLQA